MILYFDNYITNAPLFKYLYDDLSELRKRSKIYAAPSKIDVTLYTLASYATYPWSGVLIKYELEDKSQNERFEREVRKMFPKAVIIAERSDSQKKYQEAYKILEKMGDDWVFYAGNNDHPFMCPDFSTLDRCLEKAKELRRTYEYVSIWYSHILEGAGLISNREYTTLLRQLLEEKQLLFENADLFVCKNVGNGEFHSIQILDMRLLKHWFFGVDMGSKRIRRSDDLPPDIKTDGQIVIYPKRQVCDHFDGYSNLNSCVGFDISSIVPPQFLPPGFFEGKIKIAFGYEEYREGWVNIKPAAHRYSFEAKDGADLKIGLRDLPLFWKAKVEKTDINPEMDYEQMEALGNENCRKIWYPWPKSTVRARATKYFISPLWKLKKLVRRTLIYFKDPDFLEQTKDEGGQAFRLYKKSIYRIVRRGRV